MIGRIRERSAFERLRREGQRLRADPLWGVFVSDPELDTTMVGFAIGRAVGTAVRRNRLRRRLRALLADAELPPGLLLVGVRTPTPPSGEHTFEVLSCAVSQLAERMRSTLVRPS